METQKIIWRDDDLGYSHIAHAGELIMPADHIFRKFEDVDRLFLKYGVKHTIAVIAKDIEQAGELIDYVKRHPHIDVQLHCWDHLHYPKFMSIFKDQLRAGIEKLTAVFGSRPTVFYPPYNDVCLQMEMICRDFKIEMSHKKMSLSAYLKGHKEKVINFHSWADECVDLEEALKKYTGA